MGTELIPPAMIPSPVPAEPAPSPRVEMSARELVARVEAAAPDLTPSQRLVVARFVEDLGAHAAAARQAHDRRKRLDRERLWEEQQLTGADLERRRREPA
jgi:hypothetical protein